MIEACLELAEAAESLAGRSNAHASSDLTVAALLADAAAQAAAANVLSNLPSVDDPEWAVESTARVVELLAVVTNLASTTREIVGSGEVRDPVAAEYED
jgi:formiminotetrahydrofolate cyclodeaminase